MIKRKRLMVFTLILAMIFSSIVLTPGAIVNASTGDNIDADIETSTITSSDNDTGDNADIGGSSSSGSSSSSGGSGSQPSVMPEKYRNVAFRRAVYHSSAINFNETGHLITDGIIYSDSFESSWISKTSGTESVYVDLGAISVIDVVEIYWGANYAVEYEIQVAKSTDSWKTVASVNGSGGIIKTEFDEIEAQFVRVICKKSSGANYVIKEMNVYGDNDLSYSIEEEPAPLADGTQYLTGGKWKVQRASEVVVDGTLLASALYDDTAWLPAVVPGTVLTSYLSAGAIPDPNFDDQQLQISDSFFTADFWYRDSFDIPAAQNGNRVVLNFDAINWKADVFFNGQSVGQINGAFIRGKFDVTSLANYGGKNYLAILIHKNDTPGVVTLQDLSAPGPNGGALGADNPTIHAAVGWDWVPTIRGRATGIYNDVYVTYSGNVRLVDPWVITNLDLNEQPIASTYPNLADEKTATAVNGNALLAIDGDTATYWQGANEDGESFIIDLGSSQTFRTIMVNWLDASPWNASHAEVFNIHYSADGTDWSNFAVNQTGSGNSNVVQSSANVTGRYIRFTSVNRCSNGYFGTVATCVTELSVFNATVSQLVTNAKRVYKPDFSKSDILVKTEVSNVSNVAVLAKVSGTILPDNIPFSKEVELGAGETKEVEITAVIPNPKLWWPNTYGEQYLYTADVKVSVGDVQSDYKSFKFGVRKFTYPVDNNVLTIFCNGTRIICRGGNWGMDDSNLADTPETYDIKVRLHAEENFTMIRNWVGMTNDKAFYDACDKYGILVWDDFWLANPSDGPDPTNVDLFIENAIDKVKHNRYHAALALYCGRNESNPPATLINLIPPVTRTYDGTRYYVPSSSSAPVGSGGGYSLSNPRSYLGTTSNARVIRSEHGIPNVPTLDSIKRMIATENLWPINNVYGIHDFCLSGAMSASSYINALKNYITYSGTGVQALGQAYTLNDFARVSQMINYENHKGLHEGLYIVGNAQGMANGALMWMSQSAWPSFVWQTYDYYFDTGAGYFGLKTGNQPVHAVWDCRTGTNLDNIVLSNATPNDLEDVKTVVKLYDLNGVLIYENTYVTESLESDTRPITLGKVPNPEGSTPVKFLKLFVYDKTGKQLSENFYWMNSATYQAYADLNTLARVDLTANIVDVSKTGTDNFVNITLKNDSDSPALMAHLKVVSNADGKQVLPVFYSDNYISLMPGESKTITAEFNDKYVNGGYHVEMDGWNIVEKTVDNAASDYIIKDVTFECGEEGVYSWNVKTGDFHAKIKVLANKDTNVKMLPIIAAYKNGALLDISVSSETEVSLKKGQTYIFDTGYITIPDEGSLADLSVYDIKAFLFNPDNYIPVYERTTLLASIPTWTPLPDLKEKDRVYVDSFDDYASDSTLSAQYSNNSGSGSSNTVQSVESPFSILAGKDLGKAFKFTYTLVSSHTGRAKNVESEFANMQVISFWFQGAGTYATANATGGIASGTGDNLIFQMFSRGASHEVNGHTLARMGLFDPKSTEPQYLEFPLSLIVNKNTQVADFDPSTISNFGVFINTNGTVQSPAGSVIHLDEVKLSRKAPIFDSIKRQYAKIGEEIRFAAPAKIMDANGYYVNSDQIIYSLVNPPEGASIDAVTGVVTFVANIVGNYGVTVKAALKSGESVVYGTNYQASVDATCTAMIPVEVK